MAFNKKDKIKTLNGVFSIIHSFIFRFAITFTLFAVTLSIVSVMSKQMINGGLFLNGLVFAALIGVTFLVTDALKHFRVNSVIVYTVNFILAYGSFCVFFALMKNALAITSFNSSVRSFIYMTLFFAVVYPVIAVIRMIAGMIKRNLCANLKEYENIYNDKN